MLTHDNLASNSLSLVDYWRFTKNDVLIHALPIYHTHGLFVASNVTLFARAAMIFLPKFDPELIIKLMARATVLMGVPTFYTRLLQSPALTKESTKHMRLFVSGSAPLLADTHREWAARTGHAVLERYGMTETNMNTSNPYDGERVPGAVGHPLPGVTVRVTDPETGKELSRETIGMIEVKGPNVFKGYWRMPEKTKAEFRDDGFFITGDLGKIDDKGYVHILGRGKDLVISGGFNVYPKEIESEIDAMPGVVEIRRDRRAACRFRRRRHRGRGLQQGRRCQRSLGAEGARRPAGQIQDAEAGLRRRRIAAQRHGQGAEEYLAGYLFEDLREVGLDRRPGLEPGPISSGACLRGLCSTTFSLTTFTCGWVPAQGRDDEGNSFDHLVGAGEQILRQLDAERLCGLEIHHQFEFGRLLDRKITRPGAAQNLVDVIGGAPEQFKIARAVREAGRPPRRILAR